MACIEYGTIVDLGFREALKLPDIRGATLRVTRGTIWVTQQNDRQDIVLRAGESWAVERNGLTIIEAQEDTSLCVMGRKIETHVVKPAPRWWARVRGAAFEFFNTPTRNEAPYV